MWLIDQLYKKLGLTSVCKKVRDPMAMKGQKDVWHPQRGDVTRGHNVEQDVKVTFEARLWSRRNPKLDVMMIVEFQILLLTLFFNMVR